MFPFPSKQDLASHHSTFPTPIFTSYRGVTVYEVPPNGQGITALIALNILEQCRVAAMGHDSCDRVHAQVEAVHLAFADTRWYVADPDVVHVPVAELLSKDYAARRHALIDMTKVAFVALCVARCGVRRGLFRRDCNGVCLEVAMTSANAAGSFGNGGWAGSC